MRRAVVVAVTLGALTLPGYVDRGDAPAPSAERIADSVDTYSVDGSVETMVETPDPTTVVLGTDVLFAYGSSELDDRATEAVADALDDIPEGASLEVDGHTDSRGGDAVNVPLSQDRAQAVADLVAAERPDLSTSVHGHGSSEPRETEYAGDTPDEDAMAQNRRVEITWTE